MILWGFMDASPSYPRSEKNLDGENSKTNRLGTYSTHVKPKKTCQMPQKPAYTLKPIKEQTISFVLGQLRHKTSKVCAPAQLSLLPTHPRAQERTVQVEVHNCGS